MEQPRDEQAPDLTIVVPVYNEAESLPRLHAEIAAALTAMDISCEIVFVDDGSTDASFSLLRQLHRSCDNVRVVQLRRNVGKSGALSAGFAAAGGAIVVTMDADLQDDPAELPRFLAALDAGADLVTGWKFPRLDPLSKRLPSKVINGLTSLLTGQRVHDMNCGFKAYRREVVDNLQLHGEQYRFIPAIAAAMGFRVGEIKVHHRPRRHGHSKYGARRFFTGFFDLLTVLFLTRYASRPLHVFGIIGAIPFVAGVGIVGYVTWLRLAHGHIMNRHPLLIGGVMLTIMGVQIISTGLLAEMMSFWAESGRRKPDLVNRRLD